MASTSNNNANGGTGSSILDIIHEKTANVEQATNQTLISKGLNEALKTLAKREKSLRESTLTIKQIPGELEHDKIMEIIDNKWCIKQQQPPLTYWQDKESTFAQFIDNKSRQDFCAHISLPVSISSNLDLKLRDSICNLYTNEPLFKRKPIRIEIPNIKPNIKATLVQETLENLTSANSPILEFKEGKAHAITKSRSIYFRTNANGYKQLFETLDGAIPYVNRENKVKARLFLKVNGKPWQCRDCLTFGQHNCTGKICSQCGNKGHNNKECTNKTKHCNNCKKHGHRAKDLHCPTYINEVIKELRKMDLPIETLEDKELRSQLIKALQLK